MLSSEGVDLWEDGYEQAVGCPIRKTAIPLPEKLCRFDAIVSTYALHHLTDAEKPLMIRTLLGLLNDGGKLYIGDIAFENRAALEHCREQCAEARDDEECYFVADEIENAPGCKLTFQKYSFCAGVIIL